MRTRRDTATATSRPVIHITRNMNLSPVSTCAPASGGACSLTFSKINKTMTTIETKVLQASLDQLQKQLNAIYTHMLCDSIPDDTTRKALKLKTSMEWTASYAEAKKLAESGV